MHLLPNSIPTGLLFLLLELPDDLRDVVGAQSLEDIVDGRGGRLHADRVDEILNLLGVGLEVGDDALVALVGDELEYLFNIRGSE